MNPALLQLILSAVSNIPSILAAANAIKKDLNSTDLAALEAAIAAARQAALTDVAQALIDLKAAGQS